MTDPRPDDPHILHGCEAIRRFVTGGKALFTIRNAETGNRATYRVSREGSRLVVYALCGPDNTDGGSYRPLGDITDGEYTYRSLRLSVEAMRRSAWDTGDDWAYRFGGSILRCLDEGTPLSYGRRQALQHNLRRHECEASPIPADDMKARVFAWLWATRLSTGRELPEQVEVWHEGRCGRCGRRLTVPESISTGFGPECVKKVA